MTHRPIVNLVPLMITALALDVVNFASRTVLRMPKIPKSVEEPSEKASDNGSPKSSNSARTDSINSTYGIGPFRWLLLSGLFLLVLQAAEVDLAPGALYRQARALTGLSDRQATSIPETSFYAVCTEGGNRIYTSEDGGEHQCIMVINGVIAALGHQCQFASRFRLPCATMLILSNGLKRSRL